jgi:hypothetical protein
MSALSPSVVVEFCKLCGWAYESWLNHRELFDENPRASELQSSLAGDALTRLSIISQEYSLLQIVKLHDRAVTSGKITLGIEYVMTYGAWSPSVLASLQKLEEKLNGFASQLREARNKSLSHNDLAAIVAGATLGAFSKGEDEAYFRALQEFTNIVHDQVIGGPWPFNNLVKNEVAAFLSVLKP